MYVCMYVCLCMYVYVCMFMYVYVCMYVCMCGCLKPCLYTGWGIRYVNEENGARGGQQYAKDHAAEATRTSLAIESDEGTFMPFGLGFTGSAAATDLMTYIGSQLLGDINTGNITVGGQDTDNSFFCTLGVPCGSFRDLDPRASDLPSNPCRGGSSSCQSFPHLVSEAAP